MSRSPANNKRGPWSPEEDNKLLALVDTHGASNWVKIAGFHEDRTPKQCRERYHQNLKPSLNHDPITPEEGEIIERMVADMGKRWAEIARHLNGRSDNAVKNWWNGGMNRRRRIVVRREGELRGHREFDERNEHPSFARPAPVPPSHRQILVPMSRQRIEPPLTSPVNSEVSMPDSLGEAPSLVSDSSSRLSMSSPNGVPGQYRSLPFPSAQQRPPLDHWQWVASVQAQYPPPSNGIPSIADRAPLFWDQRDAPKASHMQPHQNRRLEELSEVATRGGPMHTLPASPHQYALPPVDQITNLPPHPRQALPPPTYTRSRGPSEPRSANFDTTDLSRHSMLTNTDTRSAPPPSQASRAPPSLKRKANDAELNANPPDRKRMAVANILQ
ncbi:hypothetical protein ACLMJK_006676 [Lecanora helva]